MPTYDDLLKVVNNSDRDFPDIFTWNSQKFPLRPHGTALIPFPAVVSVLGDPRSGPQEIRQRLESGGMLRVPARKKELQRLAIRYGTYNADHPEEIIHGKVSKYPDGTEIETLLGMPDVTVTNMDDDEKIVFPAEDPLCMQFAPPDVDQSQMAMMQRQLEKMRRQQMILEQQMKVSSSPTYQPPETEEDVEEDKPDTISNRKVKITSNG